MRKPLFRTNLKIKMIRFTSMDQFLLSLHNSNGSFFGEFYRMIAIRDEYFLKQWHNSDSNGNSWQKTQWLRQIVIDYKCYKVLQQTFYHLEPIGGTTRKRVENERPESWKIQKSLKMFQVFLLIKKNIFWKWTSPKWTTSRTRIYKNKGGQKVKKLMLNFYISRN